MSLIRPKLGETAPAIELQDSTGAPWSLPDQLGRPVVLIFHRHLN